MHNLVTVNSKGPEDWIFHGATELLFFIRIISDMSVMI